MMVPYFFRMIRFALVGCCGMAVDFGITWLLRDKGRLNQYLSNAVGFTVAVGVNFWLNRVWTFHSKAPVPGQLLRFFVVALVGLLLNTLLVFLFSRRLPFYAAKLAAIALVFLWNYAANALFTFGV